MKIFVGLFIIFTVVSSLDSASVANSTTKAKKSILQLDDNNLFPILVPGSGKFFVRFYTSL
jgi:hypothetical protein